MSINVPIINFGLFKSGDIGRFLFEVKNHSDVNAEILFKKRSESGGFEGN